MCMFLAKCGEVNEIVVVFVVFVVGENVFIQ